MEMIARYKTIISRPPFTRGKEKVFTEVKVNRCCHRSTTLFVVAIHNPIIKEIPAEGENNDTIMYEIDGIFKVMKREKRDDKIPVLHLNPTVKEETGMWIDLESGGLHNDSKYTIEKGDTSLVWESTCYSGGGSTINNKLIGFVSYGTIIRYYKDSYKGRSNSTVYFYEVTSSGLKGIGVELTGGLNIDDLFLENNS